MILILRPGMQHMLITQELDISNLENHMQSQAMARLFQHLRRLQLLWRQRRNDTGVHKPAETLNIVGIPFAVYAAILTSLEVEDGGLDVGLFADARLAFTVKIPDGLCERLGDVWAFLLQGVPDVVG